MQPQNPRGTGREIRPLRQLAHRRPAGRQLLLLPLGLRQTLRGVSSLCAGGGRARQGRADSNPRITFGKCVEQDGKACLPVNLTVHHALADGLHVARFFEAFEQRTREF